MKTVDMYFGGPDCKFAAINLLGHGCIIMSDDVEKIEESKDKVVARPKPEYFWGSYVKPITAKIYSEDE